MVCNEKPYLLMYDLGGKHTIFRKKNTCSFQDCLVMNFIRLALWSSRTAVCVALTCADPGVSGRSRMSPSKTANGFLFLCGSLQVEALKW